MSLFVDLESLERSQKEVVCHSLPCEVEHDGAANVDSFFTTDIKKSGKNDEVLTASFRGRPLEGQKLILPTGYTGVILREPRKAMDDEDRQLSVTHQFTEYTHWNLDATPSANDSIVKAMDWIDISRAIHDPMNEDCSSQKTETDK